MDTNSIRSYALRWTDLPNGLIVVTAYEDKVDDKGKLVGAEIARKTFDPREASEQNRQTAQAYGFKKKLQDDAAQVKQGEFTLADKLASYDATWEQMKTPDWVGKREGGRGKMDLTKIAYCLALGKKLDLSTVPALIVKISAFDKEKLKALMATDEFSEGVLAYDKMMVEAADLDL